jgi:hypothetical protein
METALQWARLDYDVWIEALVTRGALGSQM